MATPLILDFPGWLRKAGFVEWPITVARVVRAGGWDIAHRDPFDRMLAAQSVVEDLPLTSGDAVFADFGLETIW